MAGNSDRSSLRLEFGRRVWLNPRVPRRAHSKNSTSRPQQRRRLAWLLLLPIAGAVAWFWWKDEAKLPRSLPHPAVAHGVKTSPAPQRTNFVAAPLKQTGSPRVTNFAATTPPASTPKPAPLPAPTVGAAIAFDSFPRPPRDTLEAQIALARRVVSSGSIDGILGSQTRAALVTFQTANHLVASGELDAPTRAALALEVAPLISYTITSNDLARLQPVSKTWVGKSRQTSLDYETILELVAERGHASPTLVRRLNPNVNWTNVLAETDVRIPNVDYPAPTAKAAFLLINLAARRLEAFDANTNLLAHFPCSIAAKFEKRPVGELHITAIALNPDYTFNPELFPESEEARQLKARLILPPGPNNPVGTAWISLDRPGYGIHGTPSPEQVGRTESHGCFRLANWNADYLIKLVWVGMPVTVAP